eukprot:TRINITY_DN46948_c0_g1_i1.p1 TRINITY_DN46948_c0_g1~~TRINITY_DN46948_c0_g1_i1.p1  ORF type:complete len:205 (-),score=39.65 TRINITY_DN46948_c0_g1_i1:111-725(-)
MVQATVACLSYLTIGLASSSIAPTMASTTYALVDVVDHPVWDAFATSCAEKLAGGGASLDEAAREVASMLQAELDAEAAAKAKAHIELSELECKAEQAEADCKHANAFAHDARMELGHAVDQSVLALGALRRCREHAEGLEASRAERLVGYAEGQLVAREGPHKRAFQEACEAQGALEEATLENCRCTGCSILQPAGKATLRLL